MSDSIFKGKLLFLVYDSRSGSTLLSNEISDTFAEIAVGPEVYFNGLLRLRDDLFQPDSIDELCKRISQLQHLQNISLNESRLRKNLEVLGDQIDVASVILVIVGMYLHDIERSDAKVYVVKQGMHILQWRKYASLFPNSCFVHIYRDPRAVISSKLRTLRPYYSWESMAWGGVLLAAFRWHRYIALTFEMQNNFEYGGRILMIRYEDFLENNSKIMFLLSDYLGVVSSGDGYKYTVPSAEQSIHKLVSSGQIDSSRAKGWKHELAARDRLVIETVLRKKMSLVGYNEFSNCSWLKRATYLLVSSAESAYKILRHYLILGWMKSR